MGGYEYNYYTVFSFIFIGDGVSEINLILEAGKDTFYNKSIHWQVEIHIDRAY
jgi:hypothetical protein